jgi:hypothetical protein
MADLMIAGVPDDVLERLQRKAQRKGRTLNDELLVAIDRWSGSELTGPEWVVALIRSHRDGFDD